MAWIDVCVDWTGDGPIAGQIQNGHGRSRGMPNACLVSNGIMFSTHAVIASDSSELVRTPYLDKARAIAVVSDATLYNQDEIRMDLGLPSGTPVDVLLAHGFSRWGVDLPIHLVGDFAFVIWDGKTRSIFAARDPFGVRGLVYREVPGGAYLATDVEQLLIHNRASSAPDEISVLEYLTWDYRERRRTFFRDIRRIPAGHSLRWTASGMWLSRYWHPPIHEIAMPRTEDYHREFRRLFLQAVKDRLKSETSVLLHLSGGLDSSSIVCAADLLMRQGEGVSSVKAVSAVYPGLACDETPYISAVARQVTIPSELWDGSASLSSDFDTPLIAWPAGRTHAGGTHGDLDIAIRDGASTILSGSGGDQIGWSEGILRDLAASHQWTRLIREIAFERPGSLSAKAALLIDSASGAVPRWAIHGHRRARALLGRFSRPSGIAWLSPDLKRLATERSRQAPLEDGTFLSHLQRQRWRDLNVPSLGWSIERQYRAAATHGVEMRFPFLDVRLARFVLSIPFDHWGVGRYPERFHRTALADLLPHELVKRRWKTTFGDALSQRLRKNSALISNILLGGKWESAPYVDRKEARRLLFTCQNPASASFGDRYRLLQIVTLEAWIRGLLGLKSHEEGGFR